MATRAMIAPWFCAAHTESQTANWRCPALEKPVVTSMSSSLTNTSLDGLPLPA